MILGLAINSVLFCLAVVFFICSIWPSRLLSGVFRLCSLIGNCHLNRMQKSMPHVKASV